MRETLQRLIANQLFPSNHEDWYKKNGYAEETDSLDIRFQKFIGAQKILGAKFFQQFQHLSFERQVIEFFLANGQDAQTEIITVSPDEASPSQPGFGKHVVYFTGADDRYQGCFNDISHAVKTTGASYHAFEYPGMGVLPGEVLEVNDLINTGIAVVRKLLLQGIHVDDIILQGDSFGAAVAYEVQKQFQEQSGVTLRVILNNTFSSFEGVAQALLGDSWFMKPISMSVNQFLNYTGWNIRPMDRYHDVSPYQVHVNHVGDSLLLDSTLAASVDLKRANPQPSELLDELDDHETFKAFFSKTGWATIKAEGAEYLQERYQSQNTHLAGLNLFTIPVPEKGDIDAYEGFVCEYLEKSNAYVALHPQENPETLPQEIVNISDTNEENCFSRTSTRVSRWLKHTFFGGTQAEDGIELEDRASHDKSL